MPDPPVNATLFEHQRQAVEFILQLFDALETKPEDGGA